MDSAFPKPFLPLVKLNFMDQSQGSPQLLNLWGLNSDQIRDFNHAFMMFGVRDRQYGQFYKKIQEFVNLDEGFVPLAVDLLSLSFVDKQDFIKYAAFFFEFQKALLSAAERSPHLGVGQAPMVLFNGLSVDQMAFRSYELYLLKQFTAHNQVKRAKAVAEWSPICDVVLAYLTCQYGFGNLKTIANHPVWHAITQKELTQKGLSLEQVFRDKERMKTSGKGFQALAQLLYGVELDNRLVKLTKGDPSKIMQIVMLNLHKEIEGTVEGKIHSLLGKLRQQNLSRR